MKSNVWNFLSFVVDELIKIPAKVVIKKIRYQIELGGKNGYEVNGIGNYWGRYASIKKIVELASLVNTEEDWFTFDFPAKKKFQIFTSNRYLLRTERRLHRN